MPITPRQPLAHRLKAQDGLTIIEILAALLVLVVGILGAVQAFAAAQRLSLVSERHAAISQIAQREIERIEGLKYSQIAVYCGGSGQASCPTQSTDTANPDYYVNFTGTTFQWDRSSSTSTETLDLDSTDVPPAIQAIPPVQSWSQSTNGGLLSGQIYDFVTWSTDSQCSPGCPSSQDYKRVIVAVTITRVVNGASQDLQPNPVFVSSVLADPHAAPAGSVQNGQPTGNPLANPATTCQISSGTTGPCTAGIDSGTANTFFLHDWAATSSGTAPAPSADHATHPTAGPTGSNCATSSSPTPTGGQEVNCPVPDLMDTNTPAGTTSSPLYNYTNDQCPDTCYPGGRMLPPTCGTGTCTGSTGGGTGSTSDCTAPTWTTTLSNKLNAFWVTPALSSAITLTGNGGLTVFTETLSRTVMTVSMCAQLYDVPPSGSAGSLADIEAWRPISLGGAAYVPPTDPTTGSNWPITPSELSFVFNFRGSNGTVTVPAGDRIGLRVWMSANVNNSIDLIYDNPNYASQLQLNSQ